VHAINKTAITALDNPVQVSQTGWLCHYISAADAA